MGNMVLLGKDTLGGKEFAAKKEHYQQTPFMLAKKVATYETWNMESLQRYQTWLAEKAVRTWGIGFQDNE